jgi:hypothetical protein
MTEVYPGVAGRKGGDFEPLAVSPSQACLLLNIGNTRLYQLLGAGELISYNEGRARRITMASIQARVARLASANDFRAEPQLRRRPTEGRQGRRGQSQMLA